MYGLLYTYYSNIATYKGGSEGGAGGARAPLLFAGPLKLVTHTIEIYTLIKQSIDQCMFMM